MLSSDRRSIRAASPRLVCDDSRDAWRGCVQPYAYLRRDEAASPRWQAHEHLLSPTYERLLNSSCTRRAGVDVRRRESRKIVVDIGSALGVLPLYLAKRGCLVHAIDPLSLHAAALEHAAQRNAVTANLRVHRAMITGHRENDGEAGVWLRYELGEVGGPTARRGLREVTSSSGAQRSRARPRDIGGGRASPSRVARSILLARREARRSHASLDGGRRSRLLGARRGVTGRRT